MSAVQNHGFVFEDLIIKNVTNLSKIDYQKLLPQGPNSSLDIVKGFHSSANYSIKSSGGLTVACGDILNFYKHCKNDEFYMIVGIWKQINKDYKRYNTIYEIAFEPKNFHKIWGNIEYADLTDFVNYVKSIPHGKQAQIENQRIWKERRNALAYDCGIVGINAKIDGKKQRRVQCSLSIDKLKELQFPINVYYTNYLGISMPYEQESQPRNS